MARETVQIAPSTNAKSPYDERLERVEGKLDKIIELLEKRK